MFYLLVEDLAAGLVGPFENLDALNKNLELRKFSNIGRSQCILAILQGTVEEVQKQTLARLNYCPSIFTPEMDNAHLRSSLIFPFPNL